MPTVAQLTLNRQNPLGYNQWRYFTAMARHASTRSRKGAHNRQLNTSLPAQLIADLNDYARSQGRFRDTTVEMMLRAALEEASGQKWRARASKKGDAAVFSFTFPEPVRAACTQYLLYFSEFLRDIGVSVTTQLSETLTAVLFKVTPADKNVALKNIEEALRIYLALAQVPIKIPEPTAPLAERKLAETIAHLNQQLRLAQAITTAQHVRIQDQSEIIELQRQLLTSQPKKAEGQDREELFDGSVALTVFKWKGVEVSLASIFRRVRKLLKGKTA